jgi:hypothetical protein
MDATKREKVINHLLRNDLRQSISSDASENVISIFSQKWPWGRSLLNVMTVPEKNPSDTFGIDVLMV